MSSLNEIVTQWFTPAGANGRTIMYFDPTAASVPLQRAALHSFLQAYIPYCADTVSYTILTDGRIINDVDGQHTGDWFDPTVHTGVGTQTSGPVPDVAQVLVRWKSDVFRYGRRIQGRTFLPGLGRANVEAGNVAGGVVTAVTAAGNTLAGANVGLGIWSRPQASRVGGFANADTGTCWTEMATQRRRRG